MNETITIIASILGLASIAYGLYMLFKFFKTKNRYYLVSGLLLTFVFPALVFYVLYRILNPPSQVMCYDIVAIPQNASPLLLAYREELHKQNVIQK